MKQQAVLNRLSCEQIIDGLTTRVFGRRIHIFSSVVSTMDTAVRCASAGCPEGTVVASETQTRGRGRQGRLWVSPAFSGLYFSVVLRPPEKLVTIITLTAAVAVCEAVRDEARVSARIKWPNDIMIGGSKAAGILTERTAAAGGAVVMGVGINANGTGSEVCPGAVSLYEHTGRLCDRNKLLQTSLEKLEKYYFLIKAGGSDSVIEEWKSCNCTLGKRVRSENGRKRTEGTAVGIEADGGLLIKTDSGSVEKVVAGSLIHLERGQGRRP